MPRRSAYTSTSIAVNICDSKTHFSKLMRRVLAGEEIVITKAGKPVARLRPLPPQSDQGGPGPPQE